MTTSSAESTTGHCAWGDHLVNAGAAFSILCLVHGGFYLYSTELLPLVPGLGMGMVLTVILIASGAYLLRRDRRSPSLSLTPWLVALSLLLISDIPTRWPTIFHGGLGVRHLVAAGLFGACIVPYFGERSGLVLWMAAISAGYVGLRESSGGQLLFSDDHPAFLYRLVQLKEHFPRIPFYNPMWNGGVEAREFFPSGILNVYFLLWPLIAVLDPVVWYNELIAVLFFVVHPACTYLAVRVLGIRAPAAPILTLFPSTLWFRYEFQYGTLGFLTSGALTPLFFALLIRIAIDRERVSLTTLSAFIVTASLLSLWTPAAVFVIPAILVLGVPLARFAMTAKGMATIGILLLLNGPWMLIFIETSRVASFMTTQQSGERVGVSYPELGTLLESARDSLRAAAPALLLLTIPGLLALRRSHAPVWRVFGLSILVFFACGLFLAPFKPRLELGRLMILAVYLCSVPTAVALARMPRLGLPRLASGMALGSVLLVPAVLYVFTALRTLERFSPSSAELPGLVRALSEHAEGGRIAFSGHTHHQLDGGHVTPLPHFAGVPLYASRYQHDRWHHVDFIPTQFRPHHDAGIETFFDLYNITGIAVHDAEWKPWFAARPSHYEKVWEGKIFDLYRRRFGPRSWFLEGAGEVIDQTRGEIRFRVESPSGVLRFNWLPFLEVEGCERIAPEAVYEGIEFIRYVNCVVGEPLTIRARTALSRVLSR